MPTPSRIISLVPSKTELLFDLGLDEEVVGITKFCIHPQHWFRTKTRVGGTKNVNLEKVASLNPDLIIANREENTQTEIEWLMKRFNVYLSDILTVDDALNMIGSVGAMTGKEEAAARIIAEIQHERGVFARKIPTYGSVVYLIWKSPWMGVGRNTFIHAMLREGGWENALEDDYERYPELTLDDIVAAAPQHVFLSSEPYPFKDQHIAEIKEKLPFANIRLVDGEMFSWYGSRMIQAFSYFDEIRKPTF